ncbi:hypothetical protein [Paenibacillus herberti]|uniref:Uncharacterized protein n=1 Tax=Paenibacillus herberti TaxID=1619309 RepID=A0A229P5B7_9BACL|nr:hypothetical protein [Paenibacillus herberti]OXM17318.1 hypothetical protein CGZ75_12145 [Paenibacillus herberti]
MPFQFNPPDGFRNTVTFPQKPANETAFRDQMMQPLDQMRDYINGSDPLPQYSISNRSKQAFINGGFDIWQRGSSFSGRNIYTADRWIVTDDGGSASYAVSRLPFPSGEMLGGLNPNYYLSMNVTSLSTGAVTLGQRIEDVRTFAGQKVTLSMYARCANYNSTIDVAAFQIFGSAGSPSPGVSVNSAITLTTTFQPISITLNIPTITGKTITDNSCLYFQILRLGSTAKTGTYEFANVQLNVGEWAFPFASRSIGEELDLCQRYYEKSYDLNTKAGTTTHTGSNLTSSFDGTNTGTTVNSISFKTPKRIAPTVKIYGITGMETAIYDGIGDRTVVNGSIAVSIGERGFVQDYVLNGPQTPKRYCHWTADAEL